MLLPEPPLQQPVGLVVVSPSAVTQLLQGGQVGDSAGRPGLPQIPVSPKGGEGYGRDGNREGVAFGGGGGFMQGGISEGVGKLRKNAKVQKFRYRECTHVDCHPPALLANQKHEDVDT